LTKSPCPFCRPDPSRIIHSDATAFALWDAFPVSPGHALVLPRRHVSDWFETSEFERAAMLHMADSARAEIERHHQPAGYNLGLNIGVEAGQTIDHVHLHLIPRYKGDVPDPRGGVRYVLPQKANYIEKLLTRGGADPLRAHLLGDLDLAWYADIAVSFVQASGLAAIWPHLREALNRGARVRLLTGDYLGVTDPDALMRLLDLSNEGLSGELRLRVFESGSKSFHPKAYVFRTADSTGVAYVGSSNLSASALGDGIEWNFRVVHSRDAAGFAAVLEAFEELFAHPATKELTQDWVNVYRRRRILVETARVSEVPIEPADPVPEPNAVQREALAALRATREAQNTAGLVVLATGLGKTWLSAFDSEKSQRVLFVAHREEILGQALETFRRIRRTARLGHYTGAEKTLDADVLFASIQTLGQQVHLDNFRRDQFDYVVVDEFHHAAATTYRRLLTHFQPKFLLGLTATPERTDGGDLLALCQENLVYRCDLTEGIRRQLLSPFHYFGVPDEVDYSNIPWRSTRFDEAALTAAVATTKRAENIFDQFSKRAGLRVLGFCCSQRHAEFMRDFFRERGVAAAAVHSGEGSDPRSASLEMLESGELRIVFAVDMFNEGVDLPLVDTVMMLRPTESEIVWLQQLGRGLRRTIGKARLVVIDYIGNHRTFLLKPRTLLQVGASDAELSAALKRLQAGELDLPPGCEVTYELGAIDVIQALLRLPKGDEALKLYYQDYKLRHGVRPKAVQAFHDGYLPRSAARNYGSWLGFVREMGDVDAVGEEAFVHARSFLTSLESTQMTRAYKMVLLLAMLNAGAFPGSIRIADLVREFASFARKSAPLRQDVSVPLEDERALRKLLEENPIAAFLDGKGMGASYFGYDGQRFSSRLTVPAHSASALAEMVQEVAEWCVAEYLVGKRAASSTDLTLKVSQSNGRPILFLPDRNKVAGIPVW
jgi:superfamily II DNA or RNA helicase/HKD family nuclease